MVTPIIPTNGMVISEDTILAEGVFHLPDGIRIGADGISVKGNKTMIISDSQTNVGISIDGYSDINISNLTINGFYHGVRVDNAKNIRLENITVRGTQEIEGIETFLYLWLPIEKVYGGAILLNEVSNSQIVDCDIQHQMNGILLYGCQQIQVDRNNGSFNSGWGLYLSNTNNSVFQENQFDFCNRVYRREDGSVRVEADASGIVLVKGSSRNKFLRNSCLCGGDGIFLCGYEHPGIITPCNDNLFEENDCRLSPNNAIESTFSGGNIFRRNDCSRSNYAFWMGYSWDNVIEDNIIEFSRWAGLAIEHAFGFEIRGNRIHKNGEGLRLFTRGGPVLDYFPDRKACYNFNIENNNFSENKIAFNAYTGAEVQDDECRDFVLKNNQFTDNHIGAQFKRVKSTRVENNTFKGNLISAIQQSAGDEIKLKDNEFEDNAKDYNEVV